MNYTIGEMSKLTGLRASTLRFYDNEGLLPFLRHDENNQRIFSSEDYQALKVIDCLKKTGLSIKEIKTFMKLVREGDATLKDRLEIFEKQRAMVENQIAKLYDTLNIIEYKCWYYDNAVDAGNEEVIKKLSDKEVPEKFREVRKQLNHVPEYNLK